MEEHEDDVYEEDVVEEQLDDDEMSPEEAAFMEGYDKDADEPEEEED